MTKINSVKLTNLRNGEYLEFLGLVVKYVDAANPKTLKVAAQYSALFEKVQEMETLYQTDRKSAQTAEIEALDARRDDAFRGMMAMLRGLSYSSDPETKSQAQMLLRSVQIYGENIAEMNYLLETAAVRNLVDDWMVKAELKEALSKLGLLSWVTELSAANTLFEEVYLTRNDADSTANPVSLRTYRLDADRHYYALRNRLNAYAEIEGTPLYLELVAKINALVDRLNSLLARKHTGKETPEQK